MLDNFSLVVVAQRVGRLHAEWLGAHGFCAWMTSPRKNVAAGEDTSKTVSQITVHVDNVDLLP
jgi:hypothetical protein